MWNAHHDFKDIFCAVRRDDRSFQRPEITRCVFLLTGIILLVLKLSAFLAKFHSWHHHAAPQEWSPPQPIHVHVHNSFPYAHAHGWAPSGPGMDEQHYYYKG